MTNLLQEKILGKEEIKEFIPHRGRWLLLDKIADIQEKSIVAIKTFTVEECEGHFGIVPGHLVCESLAQAGAVLVNHRYAFLGKKKVPLLRRITDAKFFSTAKPGERVTLEVELINSREEMFLLKGVASVSLKKIASWEGMGLAVDELKF